jgi:hypothetical protein
MALVNAYRKDTGEQVLVPEHWFAHPFLGDPFTRDAPAPVPTAVPDHVPDTVDAPDAPATDPAPKRGPDRPGTRVKE